MDVRIYLWLDRAAEGVSGPKAQGLGVKHGTIFLEASVTSLQKSVLCLTARYHFTSISPGLCRDPVKSLLVSTQGNTLVW